MVVRLATTPFEKILRFLLTRRDKPVAAIVSLEDLHWLQQREDRQGLAAIAGKWQDLILRKLPDPWKI